MATQFPVKKGAAATIIFPILDADGDLVIDAADLDSEISKDGGTFADCTNEAVQLTDNAATPVGVGMYALTLTTTETTADSIALIIKTSTVGAKTTPIVIYTSGQTLDEIDTVADAIKFKTDNLPADPASETNVNANETKIDTKPTLLEIEASTILAKQTLLNTVNTKTLDIEKLLHATINYDKSTNVLSLYEDAAMTTLIVSFDLTDNTNETTKVKK